jgi:hypothetical protein
MVMHVQPRMHQPIAPTPSQRRGYAEALFATALGSTTVCVCVCGGGFVASIGEPHILTTDGYVVIELITCR